MAYDGRRMQMRHLDKGRGIIMGRHIMIWEGRDSGQHDRAGAADAIRSSTCHG